MAASAVRAAPAEPPVRDGLILHFDLAAQAGAREAASLPPIGNGSAVDLLLDGSGAHRDAHQPAVGLRPVFITDGSAAYARFDGRSFLGMAGPRISSDELTIFLLAAPATNRGGFTGMFAAAAFGANDYTTGVNVDFGPAPSSDLEVVNVEAAGASGYQDLLSPGFFNAAPRPFGAFHVFTIRVGAGTNGVEVFLDGFRGGGRARDRVPIAMDQVVVGGRFYSNDPGQPPHAQGFFEGAIAEVLVYDRALPDAELRRVEEALAARVTDLDGLLHGRRGHALETVEDAPVVQMLVPGFEVHELPLRIGNVNNVRYRHDGRLVAQGYDGRIHLLSDTDGDGLEDHGEVFWDKPTLRTPIGIALTPKDDPRGDGVFVASKGKVSLILDRDRDGRADEEVVIASGWPEPFHSVDALGLAIDPSDGSIYFGFGCANFVDAYQIDPATGQSRYDLGSHRGTIQRISPDFSTREIVCTGVRYTCALAFNRHGDLFATDQEGATWLPNGNPFDELLHIQPGRHYGFPPRHPRHLPGVVDQPAVLEYGPQHQSTVGLAFNEGVHGGPHFGPAHWQGDALVTGAARGKLYRTQLAKTPLGYVARNHLIAAIGMLAIDVCVSPRGDLILATHSGPPDWGTGPGGEGRIFRIRYANRDLPQPVWAWAEAPDEFRIAFDRPLDPEDWKEAPGKIRIEAGEFVAAGDRFEVIRPGYQVVRDQMVRPRRWVDVLGLSLTPDHRTLAVRVPRQVEPVHYAITLPLPPSWKTAGGIAQHAEMDVALTLNGVVATLEREGTIRRAILPHSSLEASAWFTRGSADHERFLREARAPGARFAIETLADVSNPFTPSVQPGSKLDWDPDDFATAPFAIRPVNGDGAGILEFVEGSSSSSGRLRGVRARDVTDGVFLERGDLKHPLTPQRNWVTWVREKAPDDEAEAVRTDVAGNWLRGRDVFFGDAGCATCHTIRGEGTPFGPDLSNLVHRDRESVLQDILKPSATINPDHTGTVVTTTEGVEHHAMVRSMDSQRVVLGFAAGVELEIPRAQLAKMEPMQVSLMPEGTTDLLTEEQIEDLLTFLLVEGLRPAPISRVDPPPPAPRKLAEVTSVLEGMPRGPRDPRPLRILLSAGPKDHGPDEHDYPLWLDRWSRLLRLAPGVTVETAMGFPEEDQLRRADVAVFYNANPEWDLGKAAVLDRYHELGGGVVYIHYAVDGGREPAAAAERMGLAFTLGSRFRHGEFDLVFPRRDHPVTRGFPTLRFTDETYWNMLGDPSRLHVLGTAVEDGGPRPELWCMERGRSRIVGCIPGHYTWTFDDPLFRILVFRSICWTAREPDVDRLAELALIGARWAPDEADARGRVVTTRPGAGTSRP